MPEKGKGSRAGARALRDAVLRRMLSLDPEKPAPAGVPRIPRVAASRRTSAKK
jgi:hypothetical protein